MSQHVVPRKVYFVIFTLLIVFTLITIKAAYIDLGPFNVAVALGIAGIKATLVILYFMHVRYGVRLIWIVVGGSVAWLGVMLVITMTDYLTRGWLPFPGK